MRILNVRLKNINALKGEWEVHFDRSPLKEAGIFAITGPNGSGKTTILDSMSLALYGKTSRLKGDPGRQIMTRRTADCYSEVTFSVNGMTYRSRWSAEKSNEAVQPQMQLFSVNGKETLLKDKLNTVPAEIAELTGLDFKRFSRSVMLAQGETAAFLNALDNERAEILEKIIGKEIFEEFSREIREKAVVENEKFLRLREELEAVLLPDPRKIEERRSSVADLGAEAAEAEELLSTLTRQEERIKQRERLQRTYEDSQIALAGARAQKEAMSGDTQRLKKARAAAPLSEDIQKLDQDRQTKARLTQEIESIDKQIAELEDRLTILEERKTLNNTDLAQALNVRDGRRGILDQTLALDKKIEIETQAYRGRVDRYGEIQKAQNLNLQLQNDTKNQIAENMSVQEEAGAWLKEHETESGLEADIPLIKQALERLRDSRRKLEDIRVRRIEVQGVVKKASASVAKAEAKAEKLRLKSEKLMARKSVSEKIVRDILGDDLIESFEKEYQEKVEKLTAFKRMLKIGKHHARQLKKNGKGNQKINLALERTRFEYSQYEEESRNRMAERQRLEEARIHYLAAYKYRKKRTMLQFGMPCPLCGATHHPYVDNGLPFDEDPHKNLKIQVKKLEKVQKRMARLWIQITNLETEARRTEILQTEWEELSRKTSSVYPIEDRAGFKQIFVDLKQSVRIHKQNLKTAKKHQKKTLKLDRVIVKKTEKLSDRQITLDELRSTASIQRNILAALDMEDQSIRRDQETEMQGLSERLKTYALEIPAPQGDQALLEGLNLRRDEYLRHVNILKDLKTRENALRTRAAALPEELKHLYQEAEALETEIKNQQESLNDLKSEREKVFGTGDAFQEKQHLENQVREKEDARAQIILETETSAHTLAKTREEKHLKQTELQLIDQVCLDGERHLSNQVIALGFRNADEIRESLLPAEELAAREKDQAALDQEIETCRSRMDAAREKLNGQEPAQDPLHVIQERIQDIRNRLEGLSADLKLAKSDLNNLETAQKNHAEKTAEIEAQQILCGQLNGEVAMLDSSRDAEIRARVREIMMDRLLDQTNKQMEELSGRYILKRREGQNGGLGLEVEDLSQGGLARPVETLSGGESFLVSLSLAMGLSELASKKRKIESLFIDEGFGLLDDETLYRVLSILKNIKANGKMVGVISHVRQMADEIPTQIRLTRVPGGESRLEVVA
jgi:DNA repair exonuclease SbcCD ATPase subunit